MPPGKTFMIFHDKILKSRFSSGKNICYLPSLERNSHKYVTDGVLQSKKNGNSIRFAYQRYDALTLWEVNKFVSSSTN
ncbi:hypothetical protein CEXT_98511 [Caerostris extrusa]|uniref:Uncharacterized protein n=1 Tax=Caerostris extrusa TaxID=172846 RepID=A0AAV4XGX5_CAEEX|nr:hypothetical protein CEXT_98511 [Caerostris extrusa]